MDRRAQPMDDVSGRDAAVRQDLAIFNTLLSAFSIFSLI